MALPEEEVVVKATVFGGESDRSNVVPFGEDERVLANLGAIPPPYDPWHLSALYERSSSLRPNVEAMSTNVESFGYRLEPAIDLEAPDADERVRDSLIVEALFDGRIPSVDAARVAERREELTGLGRIERLRAKLFFETCCLEMSFTELRMRTRVDMEVTGNAYWEALRNKSGDISKFNYVPSVSMRLLRIDEKWTDVKVWQRVSDADFRRVDERRRFRRFVQVVRGQEAIYFKEFGDPRCVSARTGRIYRDQATFRREEGEDAIEATEIIHFKIHSPSSVYGVPRWVGASLAVLGTRDSEEVNVAYFRNKAVPPLAILVSGGQLAAGAADRISDYIREQIKGKDNFHSVLVLEAEPASGGALTGAQGSRVRIEIKNLMEAQQQDALFQAYEGNNAEKVGNAFRIPRILRGSMTDFNRSTSEAAIRYAEQQVFQPERSRIDHVINNLVLVDRGVRFVRFVSNSPVEKDPPALVDMATKLVEAAVITPNEARLVAADAFNTRFDKVDADWARIPSKAAAAGFSPEMTPEQKAEQKEGAAQKPDVKLAPTDAAKIVTVNEARTSLGLPALTNADGSPNPDGALTLAQFEEKQRATGGLPGGPAPDQQVAHMMRLRDKLREYEGKMAAVAIAEERKREAEHVMHVPTEEWRQWFQDDASETLTG